MAVLTLGFGVVALRVAPAPGTSAHTATWFMAGFTFTLNGGLTVLHSTAAVAAVLAGSGSQFYTVFLHLVPIGNNVRSLLTFGFALGMAWVLLLGRPAPAARPIVFTTCLLMLVGVAMGLSELPLQQQAGGRLTLHSLGAVSALLLFAALYRGMMRGRVDWLLWTALALNVAMGALSSNIQIVLAWFGFGGGWAPKMRSIMWAGLVSAVVMLACSVLRLRAKRMIELRTGPPPDHHPGHRLLAWASILFSPRDVDEVIEPAVTDMRIEYSDALIAGHPAHARWVRVRGTYGILATVALLIAARSGRLLVTVWRLISRT